MQTNFADDTWTFQRPWISFFWGWLLTHLLSGALAGVVEVRLQFLGTLILAGSVIAVAEWFFLRPNFKGAGRWTVMMALGWPAAHLLYTALPALTSSLVTPLVEGGLLWEVFWISLLRLAFVLLLIGALQWLVTLPLHGVGSWWLGVSLLAGAVQGALSATVCYAYCTPIDNRLGDVAVGALLGSIGWLGYALVTGVALTLWQQHRS